MYATVTAEPARVTVGTIVTDWPTPMLDADGEICRPLIAAAGAAIDTEAAAT